MRLRWGRPDLRRYASMCDLPVAADPHAGTGPSVTFGGVSTLLVRDGSTGVLFDGFFSRPGLLRVVGGRLGPDAARIEAGLERLGVRALERLEAVVPVHSHYDHALDAAEVARITGADLLGGESTANLGRGAGLDPDTIHVTGPGAPQALGDWTLTLTESRHCPPDRFPGTIDEPLRPPARVSQWRCGEAWSAHLRHADGATVLVQGSAGFVPGALEGMHADVVYLGVGQLGVHPESYLRGYWDHVVRAHGGADPLGRLLLARGPAAARDRVRR